MQKFAVTFAQGEGADQSFREACQEISKVATISFSKPSASKPPASHQRREREGPMRNVRISHAQTIFILQSAGNAANLNPT